MKTYNPNKKVAIEICAPTHPANDYTLWDMSAHRYSKVAITHKADDSDIEDILSANDFKKFESGEKFTFRVPASVLTDKFQYLY